MRDLGVTPLFGRSAERAELLAAFADPQVRLVTITGRGGVGKTCLAMDVIPVLREAGLPVRFVALAGVAGPELAVAEVATAFGVVAPPNVTLMDALADRLQHDELLLLLDNFEHVLAAAPELHELLDRCPGLRVLVTSQAPLRLQYERVLTLSPLPVPEPGEDRPEVLMQSAAVEIYCSRAAAVDRTFELHEANAAAIAELCGELEGLPLAIELAAARAKTLPAAEVVRHLDGARLEVVRRRRGDAPARHDDLRAAINWTYDVLMPDEQHLLCSLAVLSGTFDLDAVVHLSGASLVDALDRLETLVDFHLVDPVPMSEPVRFQIPSSVRSFGCEQLAENGELEAAGRAHISYRASQARAGAAGIASRGEVLWFQALSADHDDLVASLKAALDAELSDVAIDLVVGLAPVWSMRGYHRAQAELVEDALRLGTKHDVETVAYANALLWSALLGLERGSTVDPGELVDRLRRGEELARATGDDATLLRALAFWLLVAPYTGDVAQAQAASNEGLALAARTGDERWLGQIEAWSGMLATLLGDEARAVQLGRDALARARRRGDDRTLVLATMLLMPLRRKHPEVATEMPSTEDALAAARRTGLGMYEALLLPMMVGDAAAAGDAPAALRLAAESLVVARSMVGSAVVGYNRMIMVSVMALCGADATAAYFHGTVRDEIPALSRTMSPKQVAAYDAALEQTRMRLGDQRFEAEARRGALRTPTEALEDAIAFVQETSQRLGASVPAAGAESTEGPDEGLTRRQREVLDLLVEGLSNKEIAARLDVSPKTVMHHTMAIYRALGVRGRAEAAVVAIRMQATARAPSRRSDARHRHS